MDEQRVVRGDSEVAGGAQVLSGDLALQVDDLVGDAVGEIDHLLAGRGRRVASAAALEQPRAHRLLERAKPAKYRRMIDTEHVGRACQRAGLRDCPHETELVPSDLSHIASTQLIQRENSMALQFLNG